MTSDSAWRAGHAAARSLCDVAGVLFALTGVVFLVPQGGEQLAAVSGLGMVTATALLALGVRRAGRAARSET